MSVQSLSHVWLFATPWITARQASLSIINFHSAPKLTSIESLMPSSHLILCRHLLFLPPPPSSIRAFSNESTLPMRWPKYWSLSYTISPSRVSCVTGRFFSTEPPGKPLWIARVSQKEQRLRREETTTKIILKYCVILKWRKSLNWKGTLIAKPHQILHRISEHWTQTNNSKSFQRKGQVAYKAQESE